MSALRPRFAQSFVVLAVLFAGLQASVPAAFSQTCGPNNTPQITRSGWQRHQTVTVYIDPAIQGDARLGVEQAFDNWNAANAANNSGVTYTVSATPPAAGTASFTVSYANQIIGTNGSPVRAQTSTTLDANGVTTSAAARLDIHMTDFDAVLEAMSHEIGHPAGFGHCPTCTVVDSVMAQPPYDPNDPDTYNVAYGRPTSPTPCDNQTLQTNNYPYCNPPLGVVCVWDFATCSCFQQGGGGFDPPWDDPGFECTRYYWVTYESWDGGQTWNPVDSVYAGCW
jgi:hypothetical protein